MAIKLTPREAHAVSRISDQWPNRMVELNRPTGIQPGQGVWVRVAPDRYRVIPVGEKPNTLEARLACPQEIRTASGRKPKWA
jgi:hypothetical protein